VGKCLSRNVEESFEKFLEPDTEADNFQNLINSSLPRDTSLVKFHKDLIQQSNRNAGFAQTKVRMTWAVYTLCLNTQRLAVDYMKAKYMLNVWWICVSICLCCCLSLRTYRMFMDLDVLII